MSSLVSAGGLSGHPGHLGDGGDGKQTDRGEWNIGGFQHQVIIPSTVQWDILDRGGAFNSADPVMSTIM